MLANVNAGDVMLYVLLGAVVLVLGVGLVVFVLGGMLHIGGRAVTEQRIRHLFRRYPPAEAIQRFENMMPGHIDIREWLHYFGSPMTDGELANSAVVYWERHCATSAYDNLA